MNRRRLAVLTALMVGTVAACDPLGPLKVLSDEPRLDKIVIKPDSTDLKVGDSIKVDISLVGKGGGTVSGTPVITLGNPFLISVSPAGYVKGLRVGRTEVLATVGGKRGAAVINVTP